MKKWWLLFVALILALPVVFGFGLASDYLNNNTLLLAPGAQYEYRINIQNPLPEPISVNLLLKDDEGIASFNKTDNVFDIPARSYDLQIPLFISIPWYIREGKIYEISYSASPLESSLGGIGFGISLSRSFSVRVSNDGFVSRGILAEKKDFSTITASAVKKVSSYKFEAVGIILSLIGVFIVGSLLWKRSDIFSRKVVVKNDKTGLSYSTLPEFYRVMASIDGETFWKYVNMYDKELKVWLASVSNDRFARELMSSSSRTEFFQRLKYELKKH